ncbi:polyhydroxyalkanoate depolymerase [Varunaivibrio sulfuroxidans]|uniref:Poly(3-hydroxybutyrate) depolymerase n=1 Tax=Varunaivibrio sulfuroxidans TaxID=1773489 RepID=A0A4R3JGU4_9PROT|nr:polyhydroxyalkanoate depolymerase [Varunaivibrio sulfuroxidans]TCS65164.1 poly(3-hydroxybutyrate) depolymerase [Varunaivibrio sulfuroxidans]WES29553.1 polyhydroxyalkanoate depolymerase [Varunaivibrio sulfuroxidans]
MLYQLHEWQHTALAPFRATAEAVREFYSNPYSPISYTGLGRSMVASCELVERMTRRYGKPAFGLEHTVVNGKRVAVREVEVLSHPFCTLLHFERDTPRKDPKVLLVAPLSGHYATLLRGTVEALIADHDVYVTDWINAQDVPVVHGTFDLDDYVDYVINFLDMLGPDVHVIAVCQPSVPVLAAVALMAEDGSKSAPRTMTLMGGPIDTRVNPTKVNELAKTKSLEWFESTVIHRVPAPHPGFSRKVYPGFIQLNGFMSLNLDRHIDAHVELFNHLVDGDGDGVAAHRKFYDEYMSVMDLPAQYYLQTLKTVFMEHALPKGMFTHRGRRVDPSAIHQTALLTVEGERDDISGVGQTAAAHEICTKIPAKKQAHHLQKGVGHYGIFNGRRWRTEVLPRVASFIREHA